LFQSIYSPVKNALIQLFQPIYDFLLVININLPFILHRFQVMADYRPMSNFS